MTPFHILLAVLVAVIWGIGFVANKIALESFSPPQLTALRFLIASVPVVVLARPPITWPILCAIGLTLFAGQFLFQFFGLANGMPPGLASIVVQTQALFTILFAGLVLKEKPTRRQLSGTAVAFAGLAVIAVTVGQDLTAVGLCLTAMSAISWGIGNVLVKRLPPVEMLNLMVWLSLVPPLPSLALSIALDGPAGIARAVTGASWLAVGAALYIGLVATVLAYAIWGSLLSRYSAATVTPFALLAPFVAAYASSFVFGERFGMLRLAGMGLVLLGLAMIVLPLERLAGRRPSR